MTSAAGLCFEGRSGIKTKLLFFLGEGGGEGHMLHGVVLVSTIEVPGEYNHKATEAHKMRIYSKL